MRKLFGEPLLASAALDRLAHGAHPIVITGEGCRTRVTRKRAQERKAGGFLMGTVSARTSPTSTLNAMVPVCPADPTLCVPIRIGSGESEYGPRLGGRAPEGIYPRHPCEATRFLLTVPLTHSPILEATVFLHMTTDEMIDGERIVGRDQHLEVVVHPPSRRGRSDPFSSELTPHPLVLGDIVRDEVLDDEGTPLVISGHKIGGRPFMIHDPLKYIAHNDELSGGSFMQVLQLDFPGSKDDVVSGNWPFAGGEFHLFGRVPFQAGDWRWFWEI